MAGNHISETTFGWTMDYTDDTRNQLATKSTPDVKQTNYNCAPSNRGNHRLAIGQGAEAYFTADHYRHCLG